MPEQDIREAGRELLADVTRAITEKRTAAAARGYVPSDADLARAVLASGAIAESCNRTMEALEGEYIPKIAAEVMANAAQILTEATPGIRAAVAEEIAKAIEGSVCEPGDQCVERFCPDCTRYFQCQADAATARRIGGAA